MRLLGPEMEQPLKQQPQDDQEYQLMEYHIRLKDELIPTADCGCLKFR